MAKPYSSSRSVSTRSGERRFSFEACPKSDGIVFRAGACLAGERENLARDAGAVHPPPKSGWLTLRMNVCLLWRKKRAEELHYLGRKRYCIMQNEERVFEEKQHRDMSRREFLVETGRTLSMALASAGVF